MEEIWKDIAGYEGLYQISDHGNVKSFVQYAEGKVLKPLIIGSREWDYRVVILTKNKVRKHHRINRLVVEAFTGKIPAGKQVDHIDRNTFNDCVNNLRIVSPGENRQNSRVNKNNKAGAKYIHTRNRRNKINYEVSIRRNKKSIWVGSFKTLDAAKEGLNKFLETFEHDYNL
jgi:hypothetical protein